MSRTRSRRPATGVRPAVAKDLLGTADRLESRPARGHDRLEAELSQVLASRQSLLSVARWHRARRGGAAQSGHAWRRAPIHGYARALRGRCLFYHDDAARAHGIGLDHV